MSIFKSRYAYCGFIAFVGLGLLFFGLGSLRMNKLYQSEGLTTQAVVTVSDVTGGRRSTAFIRYAFTVDGKEYGGKEDSYAAEKGTVVQVEYLPKNPARHRLVGEGERSARTARPMAALGFIFLFIGARGAVYLRRKEVSGAISTPKAG